MNLHAIDLNLLPVLDALLSEHSTLRAAEKLGRSQSAVSAALGRLRHLLKDPLFVRDGQKIVPTDFALGLAAPLRDILHGIDQLLDGGKGFDPATARLVFKMTGSDFYSELLMPKLAETLALSAPFVQTQIVDLVPENYVASLARDGVDLAFLPKTAFPEWCDFSVVHRSGFALIARRGHPRLQRAGIKPFDEVPIDLFCDLGHVLFSPEGKLKGMGDAALERIGRSRRVVMTLPVFSGVVNAVTSSDLVALMPEQIALDRGAALGGEVYRLPFAMPTVEICMVWHRRHTLSPAHRWMRGVIGDILGQMNRLRMTT